MRSTIRRVLAAAILAAFTAPRLAAQRATEADSAQLRAYCRLAAQALEAGRPDPHYEWAVDQIMSCDQSAGAALASRWLALRDADRTELGHLVFSSRSMRDQRIFDAVLRVAGSPNVAPLIRLAALSVLASYADRNVYVALSGLEHPSNDAVLPGELDFFPENGAVQLVESDPATFMTLLRTLARSEPDSEVGAAAKYLLRGFETAGLGRATP